MKSKILLLVFLPLLIQAQTTKLPPIPWHTINIFWSFQKQTTEVDRMDIDISTDRDVPTDFFLYISPFNSVFNGIQFYAGIQTNISGWKSKTDSTYTTAGKGGIFSRWDSSPEKPVGLDYVDMLPNGLCESAGYEGNFCSVRHPFVWTKGDYTLSLVKNETIDFKGTPHTWVSYEITDKSNNETYKIGRLLFEGDKLEIGQENIAFIEIYGGELSEKSIPEVNVTFGCPIINNAETPLRQAYAKQVIGNEPPASPNIAYVTSEKNDITVHLSPQIRQQSKNEI